MSRPTGAVVSAGVWLVDKPVGPTSHDIVQRARRALGTRKIGHTGTLDPFASGLLMLCVGWATRLSEYLLGLDKEYVAVAKLGVTTDSDDLDGEVIDTSDGWSSVEVETIDTELLRMTGVQDQRPPVFSAKKKDGVPAHRRVRAGESVELEPVQIRIDRLDRIEWDPPRLTFAVRCSSGTYVRSIARDLGERIGVGAHLVELRRTRIGAFSVDDAVPPEALEDSAPESSAFVSPSEALTHLPEVRISSDQLRYVRDGRAVTLDEAHRDGLDAVGSTVRATERGRLVAIGTLDGPEFQPRKVFPDDG